MNQQTFTKEEFAEQCSKRGYVSFRDGGKRSALKWCKDHPKEFYTEEDLLEVYRYFDSRKSVNDPQSRIYDRSWTRDPM